MSKNEMTNHASIQSYYLILEHNKYHFSVCNAFNKVFASCAMSMLMFSISKKIFQLYLSLNMFTYKAGLLFSYFFFSFLFYKNKI